MKPRYWLVALWMSAAHAADPPLTLETVLAQASMPHPQLALAQAQADAAQAEIDLADSLNDFQLSIEGSLRGGRNALYDDHFRPDHQAQLIARKRIYDGERSESRVGAAREEAKARAVQLMDAYAQRRSTLMARYFDVLLADMQFNAETEFMATAFVAWDNAKDRFSQGQIPQWSVTELESRYLESLGKRNDARRKLREKRMQLAAAMNRPGMVQEDLMDPNLAANARKLPEYEALLAQAMANNPSIKAQNQMLLAAQQRRHAARADYQPTLELEGAAAAWSRDSSTRDDLRVGLNFVLPLWQGGRQDAALAKEQARITEIQARHDALVLDVRESVLSLREEIDYLQNTARRVADLNAQYRNLALDKARAEYELELKTNLGSSMAETQLAKLKQRSVEYRLALALARLDALLGTAMQEQQKDKP